MLSAYIYPIKIAIILFPFIALLITLPYAIWQYHKSGAVLFFRVVVFYSFVFYMISAYFLVILPLPSFSSVKVTDTVYQDHMLLYPLQSLREYMSVGQIRVNSPETLFRLVQSSPFLQLAFNIAMVLPFGVYLRYYFHRKWWQVLCLSFGLSLFYELTQLSGLYGIYRAPYRYFEVDDLICNTLGGIFGYLISPFLCLALPDEDALERKALHQSARVSLFRRFCAWFIDAIICAGIFVLIQFLMPSITWAEREILLAFIFMCYSILTICISGGFTLGKYFCRVRVVNRFFQKAGMIRVVIRYVFLYGILFITPGYLVKNYSGYGRMTATEQHIFMGIMGVLLILHGVFLIQLMMKAFGATQPFLYGRLSGTQCVSTTKNMEEERNENTNQSGMHPVLDEPSVEGISDTDG